MIDNQIDIQSKLLENRIVLLFGEINNEVSRNIITKFLLLEYLDAKAPINLFINTPGGSVTDGYAIIDTMNSLSCDVKTIAVGLVASMGVPILCSGKHGDRSAYKHAKIMIHQPSLSLSGFRGKSSDIDIISEDLAKTRRQLNSDLASLTNQPLDKITNDTKDDFYMSAKEAMSYGIIDKII